MVAARQEISYNACMNKAFKLIPIGNSTGVIIPKDWLQSLGAEVGDSVFPLKTPAGIELRRSDSEFEAEMKIAREIMRRRRNVLRELAK